MFTIWLSHSVVFFLYLLAFQILHQHLDALILLDDNVLKETGVTEWQCSQ